ncbi:fibrinogen-binding adhesin SdrG C-terminal domain-containing protein, partial [Staphylococcus hominis]
MKKNRLDFLSNKQNKYSIRKFTVGTASLLIGATLVFGIGNEAKADEVSNTNSQSTSGEENSDTSKYDSSEKPTELENTLSTEEAAKEEQSSTEEAAKEEQSSTEEAAKEEQSNTEEVTKEEQPSTEEATKEEQPSTEEATKEEQPSTEEATKEEQPSTEEATKEEQPSTEEATKEEQPSTEEATKEEQPSTEEAAKEEQPSTEEATKEEQPSTEEAAKEEQSSTEEAAKEEQSSTEEVTKEEQSSTEEAAKEEQSNTEEVTKEEQSSTEEAAKEEQPSTEEATKEEPSSTEEAAKEEPSSSEEVTKEEQSSTEEAAKEESSTTESEEVIKKEAKIYSTSGQLVNDKITVDSFKFNNKPINPNQSGHTDFNSTFIVKGNVREEDYFTFVLPHNLTADGDVDYSNVNNTMNLPDLKNSVGQVVAKGSYNTIDKIGTYKFTDFVNDKTNISGQFSLPVFTDRKNTPNSGRYQLEFNVAGETYNSSIYIDYGNPVQGLKGPFGANVSSFITEIDLHSGKNEYKQSIYVNPKGNRLFNSIIKLQGYHDDQSKSSTRLNLNDTKLSVYEVVDNSKLTDSYYIDTSNPNYIDVTKAMGPYIRDNGNNTISINFGNTNKTYVVVVDGHFDESGKNVKTRVIENNTDPYGRFYSYYWDNENILTNGTGNADGDISLSESLSESESLSTSESISESESLSTSESLSISESISESESLSTSESISESESLSTSESISESESLSTSESISESES